MKRLPLLLLAACLFAGPALHAQAAPENESQRKNETGPAEDGMTGWRWANFLVLGVVLVYYGIKFGKPYFIGQTESITGDLVDARAKRADAHARVAEVDRKLANLDAEIAHFREQVLAEQAAHIEEMQARTRTELERIQAGAVQQIESIGKNANLELRQHATRLALELAEQRIQGRMNPSLQHSLVGQFLRNLKA